MQELLKNRRYRIGKMIGQGGMGEVYEAYDRLTRQTVALKRVTLLSKNANVTLSLSNIENRNTVLANEFRTLASLRHPHIISVLDYGFDEESRPFFTMDLIKNGLQITEYLSDNSTTETIQNLISILQALRYLHQRGILHRDLKPANIIVTENTLKLLDFGLAMPTSVSESYTNVAGTLSYLAPEILRGKSPSVASDLYAFGVLAYELIVGEHPFPSTSQTEFIQHVLLEPPKLNQSILTDSISSVILRLLSKDADDRYKTALDTIHALCEAASYPLPIETNEIRESYLVASTFVGRETELEKLIKSFNLMQDDKLQAWLIGGESGVGKSRVMSELRTHALVSGILVIQGQAITQSGLPYQLWRNILPELLMITDVTDEVASILKIIIPNIEDLLERDIPTLVSVDNSTINMRLPLIITSLVIDASKKTPILILLEDLQWATDSIDTLKSVLLATENMPIMIVGNYRSDEARHLAEELSLMNHMILPRLTETDIRELSSAMLGQSGELNDVIELIHKETEGNAFFIVEVVRALAEEAGRLSDIGRATLPAQVFAGGIQKIIKRRISKLPTWAIYPLQVSAIIGRQINMKLLGEILPELDIPSWLTLCNDVAVLSVLEINWQFTHDKIREYVSNNIEASKSRQINKAIAQSIEALYADTLDEYASVLAQHYREAEIPEKEAHYTIRAAYQLKDFIPLKSLQFAKQALKIEAYNYTDNPKLVHAELELLYGHTLISASQYDDAKSAYDKALNIYQELEDDIGIAKTMTSIGEWGFMTSHLNEAIPYLEQSIPVLEKHEEWLYLAFANMNLATVYNRLGKNELSGSYNQKAYELALKLDNEIMIAKSLNNLAIHHDIKGNWDKAIEIHKQSLAIRRRIEDKRGIAFSLTNIGAIEGDKGNYDLQKDYLTEALLNIRFVGNKRIEANILNGLGNVELKLDNIDRGLSHIKEALSLSEQIGEIHLQAHNLHSLGDFYKTSHMTLALDYYYDAAERLQVIDVIHIKLSTINKITDLIMDSGNISTLVTWLCAALNFTDNYNNRDDLIQRLEELKADLDAQKYEVACSSGKNLSLNDILSDMIKQREVSDDN